MIFHKSIENNSITLFAVVNENTRETIHNKLATVTTTSKQALLPFINPLNRKQLAINDQTT